MVTVSFLGNTLAVKQWSGEYIGSIVAVDTETTVTSIETTPLLVLTAAYGGKDTVYLIPSNLLNYFLIRHKDTHLVFQNAPFDVDVICQFTGKKDSFYPYYESHKLHDIGVLYRLWKLATDGEVPRKYSLELMARELLALELAKEDSPRLSYGEFIGREYKDMPHEHLKYAALDVLSTFSIYMRLITFIKSHDIYGTNLSENIQVKGDLALFHIRKNGIGFDLEAREQWLSKFSSNIEPVKDRLATWGWVRGMKGLKERYERIVTHIGLKDLLPRTEDGSISSKYDDLVAYSTYPFVSDYLAYMELEKAASFVTEITTNRIHPRYNLLVNTGRTSCSGPNFQQLPRIGGVRELFVPHSSNKFHITDYAAIELSTLAQVLYDRFGSSEMRNRLNAGQDLHKYYASIHRRVDMKDVTKQWRQEAKAANFGFPGGLGVDTFIEFSRSYGLELNRQEAQKMKDSWFESFPEVREYLSGEQGSVYTLTGRKRNNTTYCAEKNTPFQGLAADGAKLALYELDKRGFRIAGFVHDEIIVEGDGNEASLKEQERILIEQMRTVVPDVFVGVESQIVERYTK